ncbi:MAG: restriction endonuclease subunit S [Hyphomicrobium sp.]|nr:restriction endonuclease subunit S [Hyphomicrobium sp.]PPD09524.1 MAG: type I restriction endonuclease subunit R [Hyphomicrobium sp.]
MLDGWLTLTGGDIASKITKGASPRWQGFEYQNSGVLFVTSENVRDGHIDLSAPKFLSEEFRLKMSSSELQRGDILINIVGASIGRVCMFDSTYDSACINQAVCMLRVKREFHPPYFAYYLQAPFVRRRLLGSSSDSARPNLSLTDIREFQFEVPPLPEQRKIAEILRTWDEALEACERLIEQKQRQRSAVRQKVFGCDGVPPEKWPSAKLSEIVERVQRQADGEEHPVMTISGKSGFRRQDEKFVRFMAGESVSRYLLLKRGEFAYNKGNSKTFPQGCIYRLDQDTALVPFVYFAFALAEDLHSDFYAHLFASGFLNRQLTRLINSGVRNDGLLNIYSEDFFGCVVPVPPRVEQERIGQLFNMFSVEIDGLMYQLERLRQQKRGLMQRLLSGQWRVNV